MIAIDSNLLVYAFSARADEHQRAVVAVNELVAMPVWGLPWTVVFEFVATVTDRRLAARDHTAEAMAAVEAWLSSPGCRVLAEPPDVWPRARKLIEAAGLRGRDVFDARIAATCLAHGVREFWTNDGDFLAFPELRTRNPLVG